MKTDPHTEPEITPLHETSSEELELATLGSVQWHNNKRLHGFIGDVPPAEFEETFYAETRQKDVLAENTTLGSL